MCVHHSTLASAMLSTQIAVLISSSICNNRRYCLLHIQIGLQNSEVRSQEPSSLVLVVCSAGPTAYDRAERTSISTIDDP
jgi:hypothetical protein